MITRNKKSKRLKYGIVMLLILGSVWFYPDTSVKDHTLEFRQIPKNKLVAMDVPLIIDGNNELALVASSGSGTQLDPYIIENYFLSVNSSYAQTLKISNTDKFFIFKNNTAINSANIGFYFYNVSNMIFTNNSAKFNGGEGIIMTVCKNNTISNNIISNNTKGIYLLSSDFNIIQNNSITNSNDGNGIDLSSSSNNKISNNLISFSIDPNPAPLYANSIKGNGIVISFSKNNIISYNTLINNTFRGVYIQTYSKNNSFVGNTVYEHLYGLQISYSTESTILDNRFFGHLFGSSIILYGGNNVGVTAIVQNKIENNTLNELPIIFLQHKSHQTITGNVAQVILLNSSFVTIENLELSSLILLFSNNNTISQNHISGFLFIGLSQFNFLFGNTITHGFGVYLTYAEFNSLVNNSILYVTNIQLKTELFGITLQFSNNNSLINNLIKSNENGLYLGYSYNNTVANNNIIYNENAGVKIRPYSSSPENNIFIYNNISYNTFGIIFKQFANSNQFFLNNFIDNSNQSIYCLDTNCSINQWSNNTHGNYWSDYNGIDSDQNGIGDTPYVISNQIGNDTFPLMSPVEYNLLPKISASHDISLLESDIGNINWTITDNDPYKFFVYRNDTLIDNGTWSSGQTLSYTIKNLSSGIYFFKLVVIDKFGYQASSTIIVTIIRLPSDTLSSETSSELSTSSITESVTTSSPSNTNGFGIFIGLLSILVIINRRRKND